LGLNLLSTSTVILISNQKGMIMKSMKRISLLVAGAILFSLNVNMNIWDGKVEELVVTSVPELAMADGQCYLRFYDWTCYCQPEPGGYCIGQCVSPGTKCKAIVVIPPERE
jgi:hypothetical protein